MTESSKKEGALTLFFDWYSVWTGAVGCDAEGKGHMMEAPRGLRLAVQQAEKSAPLLRCDRPWEHEIEGASIVRTDSGYKLWYSACAYLDGVQTEDKRDPMAGKLKVRKEVHHLCYAESEDGVEWRKPNVGLYPFEGSTENNIVSLTTPHNVFADPTGFRMIYHAGPVKGGKAAWAAIYSASSPDGIHWTEDEGFALDLHCDTRNIGDYDEALGMYNVYVRYARGEFRRAIARTEAPSMRDMPHPRIILEPDSQDPPDMDIYSIAYARHPDFSVTEARDAYNNYDDKMGRRASVIKHLAQNSHFMFPTIYHRSRDVGDVRLAVSRDGWQWSWPERKPIIPLSEKGSGESGWISVGPGIHVLRPGLWGVLYTGRDGLHNEGYQPALMKRREDGEKQLETNGADRPQYPRWATWKENRLVALQADAEGACSVRLPRFSATEILVNYQTERGGWIKMELIPTEKFWPPEHAEPLPGYSFEDCAPLEGDSLSEPVVWGGKTDLSELAGKDIAIRVRMLRAKLYAISS